MLARDVMTTSVISVTPEMDVREVAKLLLANRISGAPVVDASGKLLGVISEGDLMRRPESGTGSHPRSWWLELFSNPDDRSVSYIREHGQRASDVMTRDVVTVGEDTPLDQVADLMEKHHVKRLPVTRAGAVVGIISRANLLQGLIVAKAAVSPGKDDRTLRDRIIKEFEAAGVNLGSVSVVVTDGVAHLFGMVDSAAEKNAARIAAEGVAGAGSVDEKITIMPLRVRSAFGVE